MNQYQKTIFTSFASFTLFVLNLFSISNSNVQAQKLENCYQTGTTSYYGSEFIGKKMANGLPYKAQKPTAAHLTLPLGTKIEVINIQNPNHKTIVTVTDRGPHRSQRILDVSYKAAQELNLLQSGTASICIRLLDKKNNEPKVTAGVLPAKFKETMTQQSYWLQLGSFSTQTKALAYFQILLNQLNQLGQPLSIIRRLDRNTNYLIILGGVSEKKDIELLKEYLQQNHQLEGLVIKI